MTILDEILAHKRGEVAEAKRREPAEALAARAMAALACSTSCSAFLPASPRLSRRRFLASAS